MFRADSTTISQFNFCKKKYLANASIAAEQTEVGVVTKPLNGYAVFMIDYLDFAIDTGMSNDEMSIILDYTIIAS